MRITVFGATGSVGHHVVEQALAAGHAVAAYTRDATRVTTQHERLEVVEGDVLDPQGVRAAVQGRDAVVVALGDGRAGNVRTEGTRTVVEAMRHTGVRRLVCQSTLGVGESRGNLTFVWKYVMFGLLLRGAYADHVRQEELVRESGLDWTIARPGAFTDGPRTEGYRRGFATDDRSEIKISRANVADFLVAQLADDAHLREAVSLSN